MRLSEKYTMLLDECVKLREEKNAAERHLKQIQNEILDFFLKHCSEECKKPTDTCHEDMKKLFRHCFVSNVEVFKNFVRPEDYEVDPIEGIDSIKHTVSENTDGFIESG